MTKTINELVTIIDDCDMQMYILSEEVPHDWFHHLEKPFGFRLTPLHVEI